MSLPPPTIKMKIRKLDLSSKLDEIVEDDIAVESPIEIVLNRKSIVTLMATPYQTKELAIGFLVDEGIVKTVQDILRIRVLGKTVDVEANLVESHSNLQNRGLILTSCGSSAGSDLAKEINWPRVQSDLRTRASEILDMVAHLAQSSRYFRATGATHSAAIFYENAMRAFAEDVGRHNAIDKVIGFFLEQQLDATRAVLVTTGRQPADLVLKAGRVGIPISVSIRGPLYSGVVAAEKSGLTLICFARGTRMNVCTVPERIVP